MAFTLCTSHAITIKAGKDVNSTAAVSLALLTQFSDEAEHEVMLETRYDWVTNTGSVFASHALSQAVSDIAAAKLVDYDKNGYLGLSYAEDTINFLLNRANKTMKLLSDDPNRTFAISGKTGVR